MWALLQPRVGEHVSKFGFLGVGLVRAWIKASWGWGGRVVCKDNYQLPPPHLPLETPQIPSNRDHKALNRGTLGDPGSCLHLAERRPRPRSLLCRSPCVASICHVPVPGPWLLSLFLDVDPQTRRTEPKKGKDIQGPDSKRTAARTCLTAVAPQAMLQTYTADPRDKSRVRSLGLIEGARYGEDFGRWLESAACPSLACPT